MTQAKDIQKLTLDMQSVKSDVSYIKKVIAGNGEEGHTKSIQKNTEHRIANEAKGNLARWLIGSGWAVTIILLIINTNLG